MNNHEMKELIKYAEHYHIKVINTENYDGTLQAHYGIFQCATITDDLSLEEAKSIIKSIVRLYPIVHVENECQSKIIEVLKHKNIVDLEILKLQQLQEQDEKSLKELMRSV